MIAKDPILSSGRISIQRKKIAIIAMALLSIGAWIVRLFYFNDVSGYESYSFVTLCWIATASTLLLAIEWVWTRRKGEPSPEPVADNRRWLNRRRFFRVDYRAQDDWPVVVVEFADNLPRRQLTYRIYDLSEEGICFANDNSLGRATRLAGFVRWSNCEKDPFQGTIVRRQKTLICIELDRKLNESSVYAEQRRLIRLIRASAGS